MDNYKTFIRNLTGSIVPVLAVASWAAIRGKDVTIKGMQFCGRHDSREEYMDDGYDIEIAGETVNVKGSSRKFNSVREFAEQFKQYSRPILVAATHVNTPDSYFILNKDKTGAMVIKKETKPHWGKRQVYDKRYDGFQEVYDVAEEHVSWVDL